MKGDPLQDAYDALGGIEPEVRGRQDQRGGARGRPPPPEIFNAYALRKQRFEPIRWIVPGYIAEGCTLLAGRPKLGKSWLVMDFGIGVARGAVALGLSQPCEQGGVLYLALEDNKRRLQRRLDKLLGPLELEWPAALEFCTEWPRANDGGVAAIREWIARTRNARLVIVDVLAMFRSTRGDRDSLYEADYAAVKELQALAGEFGIAIVVVHHTRKSQGDGDPFEKVSGTLGLSGAADTTLVLDRDGSGATLYGRGRDVEEIETAVAFDKETCRWAALGEAAEVRKSDERRAILDALREAGGPMGVAAIMGAIGSENRNAVDLLLHKLMKSGDVDRAGRGQYIYTGQMGKIDDEQGYRSAKSGEFR